VQNPQHATPIHHTASTERRRGTGKGEDRGDESGEEGEGNREKRKQRVREGEMGGNMAKGKRLYMVSNCSLSLYLNIVGL